MAWNEAAVTSDGIKLLSEVMKSGNIVFTKAVGGESYSDPLTLPEQKQVSSPQHSLMLGQVRSSETGAVVNVRIQNTGVVSAYKIKQIGIFAKPVGGTEILFAIAQDQDGEEIPAETENPEFLTEFDFELPISNADSIEINLTPGIFATLDELNAHSHTAGVISCTEKNLKLGSRVFQISDNVQTSLESMLEYIYMNASGVHDLQGSLKEAFDKLNLIPENAGSEIVPVYIRGGAPSPCMYTLGSMCTKDAGNYYTSDHIDTALAAKADKGHQHSAYENQNAYSGISAGSVTIWADDTRDVLTLAAGDNIKLTPDTVSKKITITAESTAYTAGDGIDITGNEISLEDITTAGKAGFDGNVDLSFGGAFSVPWVQFNSKGQIINSGIRNLAMPEYTAGAGISISDDSVIGHSNKITEGAVGSATTGTLTPDIGGNILVPYLSWDASGHLKTAGTTKYKLPEYTAGTGISIENGVIKHTNSVTGSTAGTQEGSVNLKFGKSFQQPWITYDAQGHITQSGSCTCWMPSETLNTAGSTQKSDGILYLIGVPTQADNGQSYSNSRCYIAGDCLYSNGTKVSNVGHTHSEYSPTNHTHNYAGSSSAGGAATAVECREQFEISSAAASYQYVKLGTISFDWKTEGARAFITLVGKQGFNDRNCGGMLKICLSQNHTEGTVSGVGALVYDFGNINGNSGEFAASGLNIVVVRAAGYTVSQADIYLKFPAAKNYYSFLGIIEKGSGFGWTTNVANTATDPTSGATSSYVAPKREL